MVAQAINRNELVRMLVLGSMADDYENLTVSIESPVKRDGLELGWTIERSEIVRSLQELFDLGLAKAYRLHGDGRADWAEERNEMPSLKELEDPYGAWFYPTPEGLRVFIEWRDSNRNPLGEVHELKKDWTPPES